MNPSIEPGHLFVVLFSQKQQAFHVETMQEMLTTNLTALVDGNCGDFIVVGIAESAEEANTLYQQLEKYAEAQPPS